MEVLVCGIMSECFIACCMSYGFPRHKRMIKGENVFTLALNSSCSDVTFNVSVDLFLIFQKMN